MIDLIKPKEIKITDMSKVERTFRISRVPAVHGRKIFTQYVTTATPKIGDYSANQELMLLMMSYVEAKMANGEFIRLQNEELVNQHVGDWETLGRLELEMVKYNTDFFHPDRISTVLNGFSQTLPQKVIEMLNLYLAQLSEQAKQH